MEVNDMPEAHRTETDAWGVGPSQIPPPDLNLPEFVAEARRQCLMANASADESEIQAFICPSTIWLRSARLPNCCQSVAVLHRHRLEQLHHLGE
jgi:hypothetical protein